MNIEKIFFIIGTLLPIFKFKFEAVENPLIFAVPSCIVHPPKRWGMTPINYPFFYSFYGIIQYYPSRIDSSCWEARAASVKRSKQIY
ncbi:MAG: hypothetical protein HXS53_09085 [Theionarchaea archaeon]|nr:hypothetical protein [Theionarchaea archaeon]